MYYATRIAAALAFALGLGAATPAARALSEDGRAYLEAARERLSETRADLADGQAEDPEAAASQLLSVQRFARRVLQEAPGHDEARRLGARAEKLLKRLEPALAERKADDALHSAARQLDRAQAHLAEKGRDTVFDGLMEAVRSRLAYVREVRPGDERARELAKRENRLWRQARTHTK